jgi:predicted HTH transcriptional regulator
MLAHVLQEYPQPVALAYGRLLRAQSDIEHVDRCLRCAEVITRYLAALGLASFAARDDLSFAPPAPFAELTGNLAFGHFLKVVQAVAKLNIVHPLLAEFSQAIRAKKSLVGTNLEKLLQTRNELGHDLNGINNLVATRMRREVMPQEMLEAILVDSAPLLTLPLLLIENQPPRRKVPQALRLLLMGEQGEPVPEQISLSEPFNEEGRLYVGTHTGALMLYPMLLWEMEKKRAAKGIYFIHRIKDSIEFTSLSPDAQPNNPPSASEINKITSGGPVPLEPVRFQDGRSFLEDWKERREQLKAPGRGPMRPVGWESFDEKTLRWYAQKLREKHAIDDRQPISVIREQLLDGRGEITEDEAFQLDLLFGLQKNIRPRIGRDILDLRSRPNEAERWNERKELACNLLEALREALTFISKNHPMLMSIATGDLRATAGSTDYIAVREALVNLFIHQDYHDPRTVAQIELETEKTSMTNAGASLISDEELADGGTSTARNPLVARALKLIGYAELAGSGLREVHRVWRSAGRRPPRITSKPEDNRFRVVLDSRPIEVREDPIWRERVGAKVSPEEAQVLGLLRTSDEGMTAAEICSGTGFAHKDVEAMCARLNVQQIIDKQNETYLLKPHLRNIFDPE